ncbi:MAG TPA: hypothetical protein VEG34_05590, partial [Thermoanaerobaculia bacterium]|nr:hypothetical protein [Thermoanaerobaculia bacterium]
MARRLAGARRQSLAALALIVGGAAAALAVLAVLALRSPDVPFLDQRAPAAWILYPTPPSTFARPGVELEAVFRHAFELPRRPAAARLRWRALRRGAVAVNGRLLPAPAEGS